MVSLEYLYQYGGRISKIYKRRKYIPSKRWKLFFNKVIWKDKVSENLSEMMSIKCGV